MMKNPDMDYTEVPKSNITTLCVKNKNFLSNKLVWC